ncbi:secretion protein HlyD family protein [Halothece sp. PCC 7418]|uniref:HlyD family efflux transporter periplasmic adaptor subunit n=1 Tax=Halothece sp. (strain PCC 7418) TaxID=65093 RepID=UPI0002A079A8|nr:HlyD family efflux transporter periplasmic adaptor subunit [Halothece sp. PCC 7418]AFZ44955.1 secretion protein HlyD family protein [Halothece sp. PCC 7418]
MSQANGNRPNSSMVPSENGKLNVKTSQLAKSQTGSPVPYNPYEENFDQSVVLSQSPLWPRVVLGTILGVITFGVVWSYFAKIEQAVGAQGQLKPQGNVKEVQSPINGVVKRMANNTTIEPGEDPNRKGEPYEEGDIVKAGQVLLHYDSTTAQAEIESLERIRASLQQENSFYRQVMNSATTAPTAVETEINRLEIPAEVAMLARNRTALVEENRLFRAQIGIGEQDENLGLDEIERLQASLKEANTRTEAARLEEQQIEKQLRRVEVQLDNTKVQLATEREKLEKLTTLFEEGGVSEFRKIEQKQQVQQQEARLAELQQEKQRLLLDRTQAGQELENTQATTQKDVLDRIARNKQQIAQIDSQLTKAIVDNQNRISELESQISQTEQQLEYQNLKAPISGKIFDLQAGPGFVANPTQELMKIVPQENLIAEVFITNQDIGFVQKGMTVDVRIDSFPFSEYGDIEGEIISIGSDALPPDQTYDFFRFPAKIRLDSQTLNTNGREIPLQSGMSVSTNIKLREDRRVISLFLERFTKEVESLKNVR